MAKRRRLTNVIGGVMSDTHRGVMKPLSPIWNSKGGGKKRRAKRGKR